MAKIITSLNSHLLKILYLMIDFQQNSLIDPIFEEKTGEILRYTGYGVSLHSI